MTTRRALLALPLLLAACAEPTAGAPSTAASKAGTPETLDFTGTTLDGVAYDAAQLAGKPSILWFWAPWCATCAVEAQSVGDFHEEYADRLTFLGIAGLGTVGAMKEFVSDMQVGTVTHLDDTPGKIWNKFGITQQSTYVLLDSAGTIVKQSYLDDLALTGELKKLVLL
ncbi:redoxin domain-containing protein [Actinoplanes sp. NPDC051851]|uniref:redoxin domain-containing protein n=1 Tax=Actinoplanes sp. NPDC051851 TaxID=3154753 RepID=UPI0034377BC6